MGKNVLIVYAHQEPKSFNGALKNVAMETLTTQGHTVQLSDLYEMKFDPVASKDHFRELKNKDRFDLQSENSNAFDNGTLPEDVKGEIDKLLGADLVILQFPLYWLGLPAILKGWFDRCLIEHAAFDTTTGAWFDDGPFVDKKVVLSFTAGGPQSFFSNKGVFGDMDVILWPIQNTLRFTGLQVMAPQIFYAPAEAGQSSRSEMLNKWKERLENIWSESPLDFVHIRHFDPKGGFELSENFLDSRKETALGLSTGQNIGLPLPYGSMTGDKTTNGTEKS